MTEHALVVRIATFPAAEGHFDDLVAATRVNARDARAAAGCFGARIVRAYDQPDVVAVISRWRDRDSLDRFLGEHEKTAHTAIAPFISGPVAATHYAALPE